MVLIVWKSSVTFLIIVCFVSTVIGLSVVRNSENENEDSLFKSLSSKPAEKEELKNHLDDVYDAENGYEKDRLSQTHLEQKMMLRSGKRDKRFIMNLPNKSYQECTTPSGQKGHCKHVTHCTLPDFRANFLRFLDYFCVIERFAIGVCCPDEIIEKGGPAFSANLPIAGDDPAVEQPGKGIIFGDEQTAVENPEEIINRPEERGCGLATKQFPKITGGRPADPGEWPWMAALISNDPNQAFCGGVLITDRHVLTAAHCVFKLKLHQLKVRLGEYDFNRNNETRSRDFAVTEIRVHLDFDPATYENDIAIVKLFRPSLFNSYIWPICMPPIDDTWETYTGIVTGWGTQFFGGPHSKTLMEVSLPIWSNERCQALYVNRIFDTSICAGAYEGGRDSCQGDSGGPLMVRLPNKRWVTVGIVSWGIRCGEPNHPGIYTRVSSYIKWIIENSVF